MMAAFARGDTDLIIARTHPSLKQLAGGDEAYAQMARDTVKALRRAGVSVISDEAGIPGRTYAAGDEVCFVPRRSRCACAKHRCAAPRSWSPYAAPVRRNGATWTARRCWTARMLPACRARQRTAQADPAHAEVRHLLQA